MIISDAITLLKNSELRQVSIQDETVAIIGFINLAVLEIHKRFNLWEDEAVINMAEDVLVYKLDGLDANVDIDLSDRELLMIEAVYNNDGTQASLNDELDAASVWTPKYHTVEIIESTPTEVMNVIYRASPAFSTADTDVIPIPPQFIESLMFYVGFKGHGSIKSEGPSTSYGYYKQFERSVAVIKEEGLFAQDDLVSHKFDDNIYP